MIPKADPLRFEASASNRPAYDILCDTEEEWLTTESAPLRFGRKQ
jgi:hypothetical protein